MKYILACFSCFILSSCMTVPDKAHHTVECSNKSACSEAELDDYIERFNPVNDMIIKNGFSAYQICNPALSACDKSIDIDEEVRRGAAVDSTSFNRFYLEYDGFGHKFEGNRQLNVIKRAIDTSDKPVYLIVYVNSWHNNANIEKPTDEVKYFPYILARRSFQKPDMNVIGVYIGWQGEKYKYIPAKFLRPKEVADTADRIGNNGEVRADIISLVNDVQNNSQSGHSLIIGKSFGGRLLSRAFMNDLKQMKSIEDWPLGKQSLLVNLNPAIGANAFDEVFENMPGKAVDVQRPVWLNMTSENDWGTHRLLPLARYIKQDLTDKGENKTIGHYKPYLSHWVTSADGIVGPDPDNNTEEDLIRCKFDDAQAILKDNKPWFEIPTTLEDCATRHLYENTQHKNGDKRYYTTALRPFDWSSSETVKSKLGYMWNFQIDESVIADGNANNLINRTVGYHSADVQTILGRMLDDMLFTPPEKSLD